MSKAAIRALESASSKGSGSSSTSSNPGAGKGAGRQGPKAHGRATLGTATF